MNDTDPIRLTDAEFRQLLDRFGADRARWPTAHTRRMERTLAESPEAARAFEAARELDAWLGQLRRHQAPADLSTAIMARVEALEPIEGGARSVDRGRIERPDPVERFLDWLTARLWRPVLLGALPVMTGLAIGLATPESTDSDLAGQIGALAFVDLYAEFNHAEQP